MGQQSILPLGRLGYSVYWNYLCTISLHSISYLKLPIIFCNFYNYFVYSQVINLYKWEWVNSQHRHLNVQLYVGHKVLQGLANKNVLNYHYKLNFYLMNYQNWILCFVFFYYKIAIRLTRQRLKDADKLRAYLWYYQFSIR